MNLRIQNGTKNCHRQVFLALPKSFCTALMFLTLIQGLLATPIHAESPNIIVILADDMGYSDLGCTGGEIQTPNLDRLASNGVLFTHCYSTSRCCPSRAALLTGQYQWDAGLGHMTSTKSQAPEYQQHLNLENVTIAEALKLAGYQTVMSGKWHVGDQLEHWPDKRGFEQFFGTPAGGGLYFYPSKFYNRPVFENGKEVTFGTDWYSTDGFTDFAVDYIENRRDPTRPFFLYLPYIAPHFPLQAHPKDIAKYAGVYDEGYDSIRTRRFKSQLKLGIVPATSQLPPAAHDWKKVKNKQRHADRMEVYAAQVDCLDQNIGRLMSTLETQGILNNTIVIFLSDNGGCASRKTTPNAKIGSSDCNAAYGDWYNVSNTPYRQAKSQEHEGGIMTPLIFHWPNGNFESRLTHEPIHIMDILPTLLSLTGTKYPETFENRKLDPVDGENFSPILSGAPQRKDRFFFWEHEGNKAIRQDNWKLVALRNRSWELYDLSSDPFEMNDRSAENPKIVQAFITRYNSWAKHHGVRDWPLNKKRSKSK